MKNKAKRSRIPGINLVPMIDVLMSVLTFFVILTMSLTGQVIADLELPETSASPEENDALDLDTPQDRPTFEAGLNRHGQVLIDGNVVEREEFLRAIATFLETHPQSEVRLSADRQLNYRQVDELLSQMVDVGGDRVLLVVHESGIGQ
ncbi:biopolymer transporter ExbD [Phormidium yuhuli AB48]|uniref:Biopolymer transporter ExbD n=1 Tax=Phormidium yuhuli AB48 TaxID=2940671 RepID=A0ABY5AM86_9CYAN|nr:biopolymer transporter ExbD [Phormidium yuhuli]USR90272.1 biopolymer transporter ExbD [Phormidium yuhuli AB48]